MDRPETLPAKVIYSRKGPVFDSLIDLMDKPRPKSLRSICRKFLGLSDEDDENLEMLVCGDADDDEVDEMEMADCQSDEEED